jgi:hypothetical protein
MENTRPMKATISYILIQRTSNSEHSIMVPHANAALFLAQVKGRVQKGSVLVRRHVSAGHDLVDQEYDGWGGKEFAAVGWRQMLPPSVLAKNVQCYSCETTPFAPFTPPHVIPETLPQFTEEHWRCISQFKVTSTTVGTSALYLSLSFRDFEV